MRTNIELDDELMAQAARFSPSRSKRGLVHEALALYVAVKSEEQRRATYRERLESVRARLSRRQRRTDARDLVRSDRDSR